MAKRTKKLIETISNDTDIRLNKYLSDAGVCSRREADKYIAEGKITIDGITAVMGSKVKKGQVILLDGKPVNKDESLVLIAFNKPRGIVCTTDKREKDNIIDFIQYPKRIYPIGRLDKDSEGLILLTNDGDIVNKILRAGNNHEKEYIVTLNKAITSEFLKGMESGVPILDTVTRPCQIKALDKFTFQIILTQGLNRQIRRMCEYFDYKVLALKRIRIMNINLGYMQIGGYRNVTEKEIAGLNELISNSVNTPDDVWNSLEETSVDNNDKNSKVKHFKTFNNSYGKNEAFTAVKQGKTKKDISKNSVSNKNANNKTTNNKTINNRSTKDKSTNNKDFNKKITNGKELVVTKLNRESDDKEIIYKKNLQKNNIKGNSKSYSKDSVKDNAKVYAKDNSKVYTKDNEKGNTRNKFNHTKGNSGSGSNSFKPKTKTFNKSFKSSSRGNK
ncbi:23S rRNA pseudouridine(2604) synthase RluF [Anaerocolumna sp. MB42-C2]|uniref:23S rRNA pseudouridine(2604) synthase RluF n=1 Tax=Anaerocolumna sp. MB42-C2 TaxID=3070997 RepID=UPI0027DF247A|nr:23S rRNA pseudouridine(2604) synthase RluF [Anaerocolumna sp. MB42-C2]WMJ88525.1 23S rRNA pseudouridine(2604) synthase RluF [Anaerocolumna sp. MB42-C2]